MFIKKCRIFNFILYFNDFFVFLYFDNFILYFNDYFNQIKSFTKLNNFTFRWIN